MKREIAEPAIKACIDLIGSVVVEAEALTRAAKTCAAAGEIERAFQIVLDVEPLLNEANSLLQAAGVIRRRYE
jgi:hypothetical protein